MTSLKTSRPPLPSDLLNLNSPHSHQPLDGRVRITLMVIQNEGYSKASMQRAAESLNLSVTRLTHLFKEVVGVSPRGYDKRLRLSKAERLIETTYLRIKEIEARCGFKDSSRFAQQFKKVFGLTPRECRARALAKQSGEVVSRAAPTLHTPHSDSGIQIAKSAQK